MQRENEIIALQKQGYGYRKIAADLDLPVGKVKYYCEKHPYSPNQKNCLFCGKAIQTTPHKRKKSFARTNAVCLGGTLTRSWSTERLSITSYVLIAAERLMLTARQIRNIAPAPVMPRCVAKGAVSMNDALFRRILLYNATMAAVRKMLEQGLISADEYIIIDTKFAQKYGLSLSAIYR